jgi:intein/homing endonuclease
MKGKKFLSDLKLHSDYFKWGKKNGRYETWEEAQEDIIEGHRKKYNYNPILEPYLESVLESMKEMGVLASQRNLQYRYEQIERSNLRMYNCTSLHAMRNTVFQEVFYLGLNGCGVGVGLLKPFVKNISRVQKRVLGTKTFVIEDNIEGWTDAVGVLMSSYFVDKQPFPEYAGYEIKFDGSQIRTKGSFISGGFKAPGYESLRIALEKIEQLLEWWIENRGDELLPIIVGDIICHASDAILSGGVRRVALDFIVDPNDEEMIMSKTGNWYNTNPQRGRTNNSVIMIRNLVDKEQFEHIVRLNDGMNDIGFVFANSWFDMFNPCFTGEMKILTRDGYKQFKELVEGEKYIFINALGHETEGSIRLTGYKPTVAVKLTTGKVINCTPDHIFMLASGEECMAKDLKGQQINPFVNYHTQYDGEYIKYGFLQGDGGLGRLNSDAHKGLEIFLNEKDGEIAELFGIPYKINTYINGYNEVLKNLGFSGSQLPDRTLPTTIDKWSNIQLRSFLRGLWSANGSVIKAGRVSFKSTCKELIEQLVVILGKFNISSYYTTNKTKKVKFLNGEYQCKESYDLNIAAYDSIVEFYNNIGFEQKYKQNDLEFLIKDKCPKVQSATPRKGLEPVYDFGLDDMTHWGVVEGIVAHNCFEISKLPILYKGDLSKIHYDDIFEFTKVNSELFGVQGCNLCEIVAEMCTSLKKFLRYCRDAAIIGTLQAGYTSFPYLGRTTELIFEREALLGVSIIGWMNNPKLFNPEWLRMGAEIVKQTNREVAAILGINPAARTTCVKPGGNSSVVAMTVGGISAEEDSQFLRVMQINKENTVAKFMAESMPFMIEESVHSESKTDYVIYVPIEVPKGAILKEDVLGVKHLEYIKLVQENWVLPGTNPELCAYKGINHNVSCTVNFEGDKQPMIDYIWDNKDKFTAISFLENYGSRGWNQAPLTRVNTMETITKEYGVGTLFASGLIVDGLHYFSQDLWLACDSITGLKPVTGTREQTLLKNYWIERAKKFAKNYFKGDIPRMILCLKDVHILHKWETINRKFTNVDLSKILKEPEYKDIADYAAIACGGGSCDVRRI